ncbi:MAG: MTH1187 family thiamine-binding protein [Planctomycetales bacterium]|nr:MTH1187 family thiamine-binding protein [Planctomycetales bacterium]NIM08968.1 MTH1187 family thiamine-binding protein [Planctomycetales bacterium]NIN08431.1 MTH1187 family thiamine-binding protein [Planctomycetales bacterium]NIN77560.1 MTH1187 family thiamine-binding protein [Planctomycetales bacterium]NIO34730.1 MTH1187 family thiamine-binding protein [Planctomycetales bacterium]
MYLLEFSMSPLNQGESVSHYVARSLEIVDASGLDYRLHAMGTIVEGELDELCELLKKCFAAMAADCDRITCSAKFDYRRGYRGRLESKVASVQQKLGRQLKTEEPGQRMGPLGPQRRMDESETELSDE